MALLSSANDGRWTGKFFMGYGLLLLSVPSLATFVGLSTVANGASWAAATACLLGACGLFAAVWLSVPDTAATNSMLIGPQYGKRAKEGFKSSTMPVRWR